MNNFNNLFSNKSPEISNSIYAKLWFSEINFSFNVLEIFKNVITKVATNVEMNVATNVATNNIVKNVATNIARNVTTNFATKVAMNVATADDTDMSKFL